MTVLTTCRLVGGYQSPGATCCQPLASTLTVGRHFLLKADTTYQISRRHKPGYSNTNVILNKYDSTGIRNQRLTDLPGHSAIRPAMHSVRSIFRKAVRPWERLFTATTEFQTQLTVVIAAETISTEITADRRYMQAMLQNAQASCEWYRHL